MNIPVFGTKTAKNALIKLGFVINEKMGKGSHCIAKHPSKKPENLSLQRPYITLPNRKEFYPASRHGFIKQVMAFGISKEEVLEALFRKTKGN